ncbi:MAG: helix-turn-helix domain-containing protein [Tepidiformaceae bacterium]
MPSDALPSGLSIREQQVFRLVREGRVDSEIAVRIGAGTGEVKQTVTVLMSKCGVSDRAGLLTWEPHAPARERRPWIERLTDRMGATVGGLVFALIVFGMGGIYLYRAIPKDDEALDLSGLNTPTAPAASPTSTPTPTPTPPALRLGAVTYEALRYSAESFLPANVTLYVATGCPGCGPIGDGAASPQLYRMERILPRGGGLGGGTVVIQPLLTPAEPPAFILGFAADPSGRLLVVATCVEGTCENDADGTTLVQQSRDGGRTWEDAGTFAGKALPIGVLEGEIVVLDRSWDDGSTYRSLVELYPAGGQLTGPPGVARASVPEIAGASVYWKSSTSRAFLTTSGDVFASSPVPEAELHNLIESPDERLVTYWHKGLQEDAAIALLEFRNQHTGAIERAYYGTEVDPQLYVPGVGILGTVAITVALQSGVGLQSSPAIISLTGQVQPISLGGDPLLRAIFEDGGRFIAATQAP